MKVLVPVKRVIDYNVKARVKAVADYGVDVAPRLKVLKVTEPPKRAGGIKVTDAADLVAKLKTAGVL